MMGPNIFLLNPSHGKASKLDFEYHKHIIKVIETLSEEDEERWEIYSAVIEQLINDGKNHYFKEIKYRLTDGENPNEVILDILEKENENIDGSMWFFKRRIEEYIDDDYFKRFLL